MTQATISHRKPTPSRLRRTPHGLRPVTHRAQRSLMPVSETVSAQREGADHDLAHYSCGCGTAFRAPVTTSVDCPACGAGQDW